MISFLISIMCVLLCDFQKSVITVIDEYSTYVDEDDNLKGDIDQHAFKSYVIR